MRNFSFNSSQVYFAVILLNFSAAFKTWGTLTGPCQLLYKWHKSNVNLGIISGKLKVP